jgi:hypothetical protein
VSKLTDADEGLEVIGRVKFASVGSHMRHPPVCPLPNVGTIENPEYLHKWSPFTMRERTVEEQSEVVCERRRIKHIMKPIEQHYCLQTCDDTGGNDQHI